MPLMSRIQTSKGFSLPFSSTSSRARSFCILWVRKAENTALFVRICSMNASVIADASSASAMPFAAASLKRRSVSPKMCLSTSSLTLRPS